MMMYAKIVGLATRIQMELVKLTVTSLTALYAVVQNNVNTVSKDMFFLIIQPHVLMDPL